MPKVAYFGLGLFKSGVMAAIMGLCNILATRAPKGDVHGDCDKGLFLTLSVKCNWLVI